MNPRDNRTGFTLVELIIAIVATAILALTVGIMLQSMIRSIKRQSTMAELQSDMRVAIPALYELAREAHHVDVLPIDGATSTVFQVGTNSIYRANDWVANALGTNLVYQRGASGGNKMVLCKGWVNTFRVINATNSVIFTLALDNTNDAMQVDGKAFFRN